jgi:NADH-quinone oxidoreductase subunit N
MFDLMLENLASIFPVFSSSHPYAYIALILPEIMVSAYLILSLLMLMLAPKMQLSTLNMRMAAAVFLIAGIAPYLLTTISITSKHNADLFAAAGYQLDMLAIFSKSVILVGSSMLVLFSRRFLIKHPFAFEYMSIFSLFILGQCITVSATDTLILYLGIELMGLSACGLIALSHKDVLNAPFAKEAAIKYIIMSATASGFLLFGLSMWYGAFGSLHYTSMHQTLTHMHTSTSTFQNTYFILGLMFVLVGFAFKLGLVPFHAWVPDVYQGASYPVAMTLAAIPKLVAFVMFYRVIYQVLPDITSSTRLFIQGLALASIIFANFLGMLQTHIRRLLAYSTIANMGFMLLALSFGNALDASHSHAAAALYYVLVYAASSLLIFAILTHMPKYATLSDLKGLHQTHPKIAFLLAGILLSMMGIPPFIGFYAKLAVINVLIKQDMLYMLILALLASVMAAFYYLKMIRHMFFDAADTNHVNHVNANNLTPEAINLPYSIWLAVALFVLMAAMPTYFLGYLQTIVQ